MTALSVTVPPLSAPRADPLPLAAARHSWTVWLGPAISLAILAGVIGAFSRFQIGAEIRLLPVNPLFWAAFLLYFLASPIGDWIIFRRLWSIPASGITALLRKDVTNRLLFGYLGELYFYSWARAHGRLTAAPFGAIKDVAILSAVCGNLLAIAMLPLGFRLVQSLVPQQHPWLLVASVLAFAITSLVPLLFGRMLFSLPGVQLRFVALVHTARAAMGILLYAAMWHLAMPGDAFMWWIVLASLRQAVTRLPFVPDSEVVFTTIAVFFLGHQSRIAAMAALLGSLSMAMLLALGLLIGAAGLLTKGRV